MSIRVERLAQGLMFPEGPAIGPDGDLYVTEIAGQRISKIAEDGTVSTLSIPEVGRTGQRLILKANSLLLTMAVDGPLMFLRLRKSKTRLGQGRIQQ